MQQEIFHECKSDLSSWPYTTAPSSSPRSLLTASDRWHSREHHSTPEAFVAESTSYLFHDAHVECTTSTDEDDDELMRCVGRRAETASHASQQNTFDANSIHKSPYENRPGAGTESKNRALSPSSCYCGNMHVEDVKNRPQIHELLGGEVNKCEVSGPPMDYMFQQLSIPHFREVTADLVVKVRGKSFKAHRFLLAHFSGYFYNLLKERQGKLFVEVTLGDITPDAFSSLYDWMYTSQLAVNSQNLLEVWYAAQVLEIPEAIRLCLDYLHNLKNAPEELLNLYFQSRDVGHKSMTDHILRVMSLVYSRLIKTSLFQNLDYEGIRFLLNCDNLNVNSEKEAFDSVICWLKGKFEARKDCIIEIMKCIRFGHMSDAELFETIHNDISQDIMSYAECRLMVLDGFLSNTSKSLGNMDRYPHLFAQPRRCPWDQNEPDGSHLGQGQLPGTSALTLTQANNTQALPPPPSYFNYQVTEEQHVQSPCHQSWPPKLVSMMPFTKLMPEVCGEVSKHERKFSCAKWWSKMREGNNGADPAMMCAAAAATTLQSRTLTQNDVPPAFHINRQNNSCRSPPPQRAGKSPPPTFPPSFRSSTPMTPCQPKSPFRPKSPCPPQSPGLTACWPGSYQTTGNYQTGWMNTPRPPPNNDVSTAGEDKKEEKRPNREKFIEQTVILLLGGLNPLESWTTPTAGKLTHIFINKSVGGRREGRWKKFSLDLPSPRHHAVAVASSGFVYLSGGCCPARSRDGRHIEALSSLWRLDLRNRKWDKMSEMSHARIHHGFVALDTVLIAIGGQDEAGRLLSSVEIYDIREDKWKAVAPLSTPRMGMGVASFRNCVWVCGGMSVKDKEKSPAITKVVECYEASTDKWCTMNSLRFPRCFGTLVECGGFLHLVGGVTRVSARKDGVISSVASIDIHDYVTDEWSFKAALQVPRHSAAAATLDHHLYVIGGITSLEACALDCVECFNDVKGCWDKTPVHLPMPLSGACCVVVNTLVEDDDDTRLEKM